MDLSAGTLENFVKTLFKQVAECDPRILRSLDRAEHTIELDYRGRYFFELLQNARDAAASDACLAKVKVIVRANELLVANTGRPFSKEGLESICSLGLSTKKNSNLFIGNKGLGFKSVLEITNQPRIVTQNGTVVFSREKAYEHFTDTDIHPDELPLLFLPMYEQVSLESYEGFQGYSTLLILPFLPGITADRVMKDIQEIKDVSYALMRNFERLELLDETENRKTICQVNSDADICQITITGVQPLRIKFYTHKVFLTEEQWKQLSVDEQKLYPLGSSIEITIGLKFSQDGKFQPLENTPLYLYYPLEERSGFQFIIHGQFIVTPNRKGLLENSLLNQFLLKEVLIFIGNQFLKRISDEFPTQVSDIITYTPNLYSTLQKYGFYKALSELMRQKKILWNSAAGRLLSIEEFVLLNKEQKNLFTDTMFGDQYLVYIPDSSPTYSYLVKCMQAKILTSEYIKSHIEDYASRQLKQGKIHFFAGLYNYVAAHKVSLVGKKILLTEKSELLDNNSEVYYGSQRTDIIIPEILMGKIVFLHHSIGLRDVRVADKFIGVQEYTTGQLTRRALQIFKNQPEFRPALLRLFQSLYTNIAPSAILVEGIQVPVQGTDQWISPLSNPVYWPCVELEEMYPQGFFIDKDKLQDLSTNEQAWKTFLTAMNVWIAPSIYITIHEGKRDITLDIPNVITVFFEKMIFENWVRYQSKVVIWRELMGSRSLPDLSKSSFISSLCERPWLSGRSGQPGIARPSEVLVFPDTDRYSLQLKPLRKYFTIYFTPEANHGLLQLTGAISARKLSYESAVQMFRWAQKQYLDSPPQEKEFSSAWNRLYTLLYEFWRSTKVGDIGRNQILNELKSIPLLAESTEGSRKKWVWLRGSEILYVDDQPLMDFLEDNLQGMLPPRFTKKDRNEIGLIINKVGIELSERISKNLVQPNIVRKFPFFECFHWAIAAVALLEDKMGNHIEKEQLTKLANTSIVVSQNLSLIVNVNIGTGTRFEQKVPFYLNKAQSSHLELFMDEEKIQFRKPLASAVQELFGEVTNADHEMLLELQELIGTKTEKEVTKVLNELNIDSERIADLKGNLGHQQVSLRLLFWNELAKAEDFLPAEEESLLPQLFEQLDGHYQAVSGFCHVADERMKLNERWTWSTLQTALDVFYRAGLDIELLAGIIEGKVDLTSLNLGQLRLLVQSCRSRFVATLYQSLKGLDESVQRKFLDFLDQYDYPTGLSGLQGLRFDPHNGFEQHLQNIATGIADPPPFLQLGHETMDDSNLYREKEDLLRNKISEAGISPEHLVRFLNNKAIKSLLFFDVKVVFEQYQDFINDQNSIAEPSQQDHQSNHQFHWNNKPVISHTPVKPPSMNQTGRNGGGGRSKGQWNNRDENADNRDETGRLGEYYVYNKLLAQYPNLLWVSENAEYYRKTIKGDDTLHYDMRYVDAEGTEHYIEVKSTSGAWGRFNISRQQVAFGLANKDCYLLYFVTYAKSPQQTEAKYLGPIFQSYSTVEDFENSPFLEVEVQDYLVRFV